MPFFRLMQDYIIAFIATFVTRSKLPQKPLINLHDP